MVIRNIPVESERTDIEKITFHTDGRLLIEFEDTGWNKDPAEIVEYAYKFVRKIPKELYEKQEAK